MMIVTNGEKAYTTKEVAEILEVQTQTVRKHIERKKLKATKSGRDYLILERDLKEYLQYRQLCSDQEAQGVKA